MAQNHFIVSISLTKEHKIAFKKLQALVKYYKNHGARKKQYISYWFGKWLLDHIDEEIEYAEKNFGQSVGVEKIEIKKLHEIDIHEKSVIDDLIDAKMKDLERE